MITVNTGTTDQSIRFWAYDADGAAVEGEEYNSDGMAVSVIVRRKGRIVSTTALTLVARSGVGVHTDSALTEVGSGEYVVDLADSYFATAGDHVSLSVASTAITGTVVVESLTTGSGGGGLTGDFNLTVTVTDADTSAPIENATVTLSRTGERGAELTDANGVAVVGLDAATWSWIVRAAGYESATGVITIADNDVLAVELDGIVVAVPADAPLCAVTLPIVDQYGVKIAGVSVAFKFAGLQPNADPGAVIMSPPPPQTSDGSGVVQVNLIRLARYTATYKHEGETRNIAIAVPDAGSFVVVEG
jgi:hypothetical protein